MQPRSHNILAALDRLAAAEADFLRTEFLAPVVRGGRVDVRIVGVVCRMHVKPREYEGFGVFRPTSHSTAKLARDATLAERRRYLALFPRVLMVVCGTEGDANARAVPANPGDERFRIDGVAVVRLVEEANLFDTIVTRFDGTQFWFDQLDDRTDPAAAPYLRQALAETREPKRLDRPGLVPGQRDAYAVVYRARLEQLIEDERSRGEYRLRDALGHAGARLRDFAETGRDFRVTFAIDGRQHTSVVRKDDLTVQTAGICLSGMDRNFDLASLVGVLRESQARF